MNLLLATVTLSSARKTLLSRLAILQDCGFLLPPDCRMAAKRAIFAGRSSWAPGVQKAAVREHQGIKSSNAKYKLWAFTDHHRNFDIHFLAVS